MSIAPEAFNHGTTRNLAIAETRGDLVVLLVQDAVPADSQWLATLTASVTLPRSGPSRSGVPSMPLTAMS